MPWSAGLRALQGGGRLGYAPGNWALSGESEAEDGGVAD